MTDIVIPNSQDPFLGYSYDNVARQCFIAMLANPLWYNKAALGLSGEPGDIMANIAQFATLAATTVEAQLAKPPTPIGEEG